MHPHLIERIHIYLFIYYYNKQNNDLINYSIMYICLL